jgi:hypothetical protein
MTEWEGEVAITALAKRFKEKHELASQLISMNLFPR